MSELSFLLELLLEHTLEKPTQTLIRQRIKEIETQPQGRPAIQRSVSAQAPSMQRAIEELQQDQAIQANFPTQVEAIAQTPAAAQAMAHRAAIIAQATSGKEERGRTSPRKF